MGDAGCGKSTVISALGKTLDKIQITEEVQTRAYSNIVKTIINPKALPIANLFGTFDESAGEWFEGLVGMSKI